MQKNRGQVAINISLIITVALASIGGYIAQNVRNDNKIESTASELRAIDQNTLQRIATLEEAVSSIKDDTKQTRSDIKEILKLVR